MNVKEAINKRRAYRSLEVIEISDDLVRDLALSAQIAPSCMNKQPWRFIFVRKKEALKELFITFSSGNMWAKKASMIIGVASNLEYDCIIGERLYYLFDTGMATALIILRATELGLVAHPIAGFNEQEAKKALSLPNEMRLISLIIVGKRSKEINPELSDFMKLGEENRPPRIPLNEFAFSNYFKINSKENIFP
ncbi:MAG: nitroreductase family protein [Promethearchaeota archaeon]